MGGRRAEDLSGKRFGMLTVIERRGSRGSKGHLSATWLCKCDCGNEKVYGSGQLKEGRRVSCGCAKRLRAYQKQMGITK